MSIPSKQIIRQVKPLLSIDRSEARRRVLNLYKAWYRQIPFIVVDFITPLSVGKAKQRLREEFMKNKHVTDIRVIDMLVVKGHNELKEVVKLWKQPCHLMYYFKDSVEPKPTDFLSKFMSGQH